MGRATAGVCDQTADTEEATAEIPEDDTSDQEKNMRKQTFQGEKKKRTPSRDWKDGRRMMKIRKRRAERKGGG